jgi:uncharacterized protein YdbL (DUF1318 family)
MTISSKVSALSRLLVLTLLLVAAAPGMVAAQSLDDLRAQGIVGERYDGIAVVRAGDAPASVKEFVAGVNSQRQKIYAERAAEQNVPVGQVGRIYAKEIYGKLPPGAWFLDESQTWRQK